MSIGLVLSGGGSRGIAHLGVLKYFEENGYKLDAIAATSSGALVAAMYCSGIKVNEIMKFFTKLKPIRFKYAGLNRKGLLNAKSFYQDFAKSIEYDDFDKLDINLHIVATNILSGSQTVFNKGSVIDAALASSSYPLIFSPLEFNDQIYLDGGLVNHFPISVLQNKVDQIIGVLVSPLNHIKKENLRSIKDVFFRSLSLQGVYNEVSKLDQCTLGIYPRLLANFSSFDFNTKSLEEIFKIGYNEAVKYERQLSEIFLANKSNNYQNK